MSIDFSLKAKIITKEAINITGMEFLKEGSEDAMQILFLLLPLRKRLRTSNSIERLNQEIRRRER